MGSEQGSSSGACVSALANGCGSQLGRCAVPDLSELEALFDLLKKHRVYVFQSGDIKVQFEHGASVPMVIDEAAPQTKEQGEASAKAEYERTLFAASAGG